MPNMELITSVTVGSGGAASVTLTAIGTIPQTYTDLKIVVSARGDDTNSKVMDISFNGSTSSFTNRYLLGSGTSVASGTFSRFSSLQTSSIDTSNTFGNGEIYIPNYASATNKSYSGDAVQEINSSTGNNLVLIAGLRSNTDAITSITLTPYAGSWVEHSTFYLYGISNVTSTAKATGGIVSSDETYWYHMFPFSSTFTPTQALTADYLVIAGGGGSANPYINAADVGGGGGGAGGLRSTVTVSGGSPGTVESALSLTAQAYTITVGAGGAGNSGVDQGGQGGTSSIAGTGLTTISTTGGGGGARQSRNGGAGGSGGGSSVGGNSGGTGTANQGYAGGTNPGSSGGGGGGAGAVGANGSGSYIAGNGGVGVQITALANPTQTGVNNGYYAGGGGGGGGNTFGIGGLGGGANGSTNTTGNNGIANTGGGAGGIVGDATGKNGGSGLVIIRYAK